MKRLRDNIDVRNYLAMHGQSEENAYQPLPNTHKIVVRIIRGSFNV